MFALISNQSILSINFHSRNINEYLQCQLGRVSRRSSGSNEGFTQAVNISPTTRAPQQQPAAAKANGAGASVAGEEGIQMMVVEKGTSRSANGNVVKADVERWNNGNNGAEVVNKSKVQVSHV